MRSIGRALPPMLVWMQNYCQGDPNSCTGHYFTTDIVECGCSLTPPYCELPCYGFQAVPTGTGYTNGYRICFESNETCGTCPKDLICGNP